VKTAFIGRVASIKQNEPQAPTGPPLTLGDMRELGVQNLIASCLNDACRHQLIDVSSYPADTDLPSFRRRMKCGKCGGKRVDVRPNWKEQPPQQSLTTNNGVDLRVSPGSS
jgi:hypothetical protein